MDGSFRFITGSIIVNDINIVFFFKFHSGQTGQNGLTALLPVEEALRLVPGCVLLWTWYKYCLFVSIMDRMIWVLCYMWKRLRFVLGCVLLWTWYRYCLFFQFHSGQIGQNGLGALLLVEEALRLVPGCVTMNLILQMAINKDVTKLDQNYITWKQENVHLKELMISVHVRFIRLRHSFGLKLLVFTVTFQPCNDYITMKSHDITSCTMKFPFLGRCL